MEKFLKRELLKREVLSIKKLEIVWPKSVILLIFLKPKQLALLEYLNLLIQDMKQELGELILKFRSLSQDEKKIILRSVGISEKK